MAAKPRPKKAASKKKAAKKSAAKKSGTKQAKSTGTSRVRKAASSAGTRAKKAAAKATSRTRSEGSRLAVSVLDLNKTTFDNAVKAVESMQKQTEKVLKELIDNSSILPSEAKKFVDEWRIMLKRNQHDFTKTVDKSFDLWSAFFERIRRQETEKAKTTKKSAPKKSKVKRKPKKAAAKKKAASGGTS